MKTFRLVSNQIAYGAGYRRSTIYGDTRHTIWINYGYKSVSWSWKINPSAPEQEKQS